MSSMPNRRNVICVFRGRDEPTQARLEAGNYPKKHVRWQGMDISIENPAGSVRRGVDRDGNPWETRILFDYGYLSRTEGVDGDHVDCFIGPNPDAPFVYVVHARKAGDWQAYDEDKCMLCFDSEDDAKVAFLAAYNDPRFLGPITTMTVDEFKAKAKRTKDQPAMLKSVVLTKSKPESSSELAKEHRRLVAVLRSPSHKDDLAEADRQEDELEEYEEDLTKAVTAGRADAAINYRLQMIAAQIGPLAARAQWDSNARMQLDALIQERYELMVAAGQASL